MLKLLLLLSMTSIGLIAAVIVFLGLAWLVVAVPVVLPCSLGASWVAELSVGSFAGLPTCLS
jgi:hypothetical protein